MITAQLHRNLSLLAVAFVAAHVVTTVLDPYAPIGWISAIVPFASPYRTLWLGLGTVAFDMLLAVVVTSLLRARLGYRAWRAVHWLGYACWPVALWHGLGTGTDSKLSWLLALDAAWVAAATGALGWRLSLARRRPGPLTGLLACAAVPAATVVFVAVGPLQPGWARRAGTPKGRAARTRDGASGDVTITVTAQTSAPAPQSLVITLRGAPDGAGITLSDGTVSVGPVGTAPGYSGPVVQLDGHRLVADLRGLSGSETRASITLFVRGAVATGKLTIGHGGGE